MNGCTLYRKVYLLLTMILLTGKLKAKDDSLKTVRHFHNSLYVQACYQSFPGIYKPDRFYLFRSLASYKIGTQLGANYQHNIYKCFFAGAGYAQWSSVLDLNNSEGGWYGVAGHPGPIQVGAIDSREHYKMVDLYAGYQYHLFKRHQLEGYIGYSKTWGHNWIIDAVSGDVAEGHSETAGYDGLISQLKYDYFLFKERVSIGANLRVRKYFGLYNYQLDYGYHISINF